MAVGLYAVGSIRNFTEQTQFFLLNVILYDGLFIAVCVLLDFVFSAGFMLLKHKKCIPPESLLFLILGLAAFIFSCVAAVILVLAKGNMT
jgi:hypothetical protein